MRGTLGLTRSVVPSRRALLAKNWRSLGFCRSVLARIGCPEIHTLAISHHSLATADHRRERGIEDLQVVTEAGQLGPRFLRDARLDLHVQALESALRESRCFQCSLDVHSEVDDIRNELGVRLRLIPSAHDSKTNPHVSLLQESRDDRVERSLARRENIRVLRIEAEKRAAVLEAKTRSRCNQARTEAAVVALDERNDIPFAIDGGHVDGVARALA